MRALWVLVVVAACEQHTPSPVRHASPPPPPTPADAPSPPVDAGVAVAPLDGPPRKRGATYCPGVAPWPAGEKTCFTDDDCPGDGACYPQGVPSYAGMCGIAPRITRECDRDRDCGKGTYCDTMIAEHHGCAELVEAKCQKSCTKDSCKRGEVCRPSGRCEVLPCTEGYVCRAGWTCDANGAIHDEHGCREPSCTVTGCGPNLQCRGDLCEPRKCTTQSDCDCGACMQGQCAGRPGVCGPHDRPQPPP